MHGKQLEMDTIIRDIYTSIVSQPHHASTLLVFGGDHGMNEAGNHGASSAGETSPALVFASPKLATLGQTFVSPAAYKDDYRYYKLVEQSDVGPTLAALLGFPVPRNNLGTIISEFLPFWQDG